MHNGLDAVILYFIIYTLYTVEKKNKPYLCAFGTTMIFILLDFSYHLIRS